MSPPGGEHDPRRDERGQALALFAGGLAALLIGTGFVLDSGFAFVSRRDAQNAADLGALAGTQAVADFHMGEHVSGADVYATIDSAVRANGCDPTGDDGCGWSADYVLPTTGYETAKVGTVAEGGIVPPAAQGVEVRVVRRPPTFLLHLVDRSEWEITAAATAVSSRLSGAGEGVLLPLAFDPGRELVPGRRYRFSEGKDAPGNFSWLSWYDDNSATELERNVCTPRNPAYSFPVYVPGGPGKMNKSGVRDCLDRYVDQMVYVPLWDDCALGPGVTENGSHAKFCIVGVAAFDFEGYYSDPAIDDVWGTLVGITSMSEIPATWSGPPCRHGTPGCTSATNYLGLIE